MNGHEEESLLSAYIDGNLNIEERSRLESHLSGCEDCRLELQALRRTKQRLVSTPRRAVPPDFLAGMEERLTAKTVRIPIWAGVLRRNSSRWATSAVALGALAVGLWIKFHSTKEALPIEILAAAHSRYSAEGLIPGDMVASNFSSELEQMQRTNEE